MKKVTKHNKNITIVLAFLLGILATVGVAVATNTYSAKIQNGSFALNKVSPTPTPPVHIEIYYSQKTKAPVQINCTITHNKTILKSN